MLGFPCNQFGAQEPGSEAEIEQFCEINYGVTFPMFAKVDVNGDDAAPLYEYLKDAKPGLLGSEAIKWNFTKFLVDRDGKVVARYAPNDTPESIAGDVEKAAVKSLVRDRLCVALACAAAAHCAARPEQGPARGVSDRRDGLRSAGSGRRLLELRQPRDLRSAVSIRIPDAAVQARPQHRNGAARDLAGRPHLDDAREAGHLLRRRSGIQGPAPRAHGAGLRLFDQAHPRPENALQLAQCGAGALRRRRCRGRQGHRNRKVRLRRADRRPAGAGSLHAPLQARVSRLRASRQPNDDGPRCRRARGDRGLRRRKRLGRWPIPSAPARTGSRTGGAASGSCSNRTRAFATSAFPSRRMPTDRANTAQAEGPQAAADRPDRNLDHRGVESAAARVPARQPRLRGGADRPRPQCPRPG